MIAGTQKLAFSSKGVINALKKVLKGANNGLANFFVLQKFYLYYWKNVKKSSKNPRKM